VQQQNNIRPPALDRVTIALPEYIWSERDGQREMDRERWTQREMDVGVAEIGLSYNLLYKIFVK
jgi:hypothetical protein